MAYNTNNPLGSKDPRDLYDNATNFDNYSVGPQPFYPNRFGVLKLSIEGMNQQFDAAQTGRADQFAAALASIGYTWIGDYTGGLVFTTRQQYTVRGGIGYILANDTTVPYTSTGNWTTEQTKFKALSLDQLLRSDLASTDPAKGSALVTFNPDATYPDGSIGAAIKKVGASLSPEGFGTNVGTGNAAADTAAWVALAAAAQDGDVITARGNYLISGSTVVFTVDDAVFDLEGARFTQQTNLSKTLQFTNCNRIKIHGAVLNGRGGAAGEYVSAATSYNGVAGIFISNSNDVEVFGNRLYAHAGGSIVWRESDNLNIHHNLVVGIGPSYIPALGNGQDFAIGGFSDDITRMDFVANISHNTISDTAFGIFHNRCKALLIEGNTITRIPGQHGIYVIECSGLVISNNVISNCVQQGAKLQIEYYTGRGVAPAGYSDVQGVVVTGNMIRNCQDGFAVISTSLSDGTNQKVYGVEVTGNSFFNMTGDGVNLNHCIEAMVANNNIRSVTRFGLNFKNSSGVVADNSIVTSGSSGISASLFHGTELRDNRLVNCGLSNAAGAGNDVALLVGAPVSPLPDANSAPIVLVRGNHIRYTGADSSAAHLMDFGPSYQVHMEGTRTGSLLTVRVQGSLIFCERNDFLSFESGSQNSPATFLPGAGRRDFHGQVNPQAASSTRAFYRGDRCWNTNTTASGPMGWVCITSGSPGVWKAMASLAA